MKRGARLGLALAPILLWLAPGRAGAQYRVLDTAMPGAVPGGVAYQGRLERAGSPYNGSVKMRFKLFDAPIGGVAVYDSSDTLVKVNQGIFGVSLDIPVTSLVGTTGKYLEITVDSTYVLQPRDPLLSVPYAKVAETVEGVIDISTGGLSIQNGGVTALYVSSVTGRVGIGTTSPNTRLTVSSPSAGGVTTGLELMNPGISGGTGQRLIFNFNTNGTPDAYAAVEAARTNAASGDTHLAFYTRAGTQMQERVRIDRSGNVGLNTTNPGAALDVQTSMLPGIILSHGSNPQLMLRVGGLDALRMDYGGGVGYLGTAAATPSPMSFGAGGAADRLVIKPSGEVGVGTTDPQRPLDVAGSMRVSNILETSNGGSAAAPALTLGGDTNTGLFSPGADQLGLSLGASQHMVIDSAGNVGIGIEHVPPEIPAGNKLRLWVYGGDVVVGSPSQSTFDQGNPAKNDLFVAGNVVIEGQNITSGSSYFDRLGIGQAVGLGETFRVGASGAIVVLDTGRVGIGTASPGGTLEVGATTTPGIVLNHPTDPVFQLQRAGTAVAKFEHDGAQGRLGTLNATPLALYANSLTSPAPINITTTGRVGISTSAPTEALGVEGNMSVSGILSVATPLPIYYGGTGTTTAANARASLGLVDRAGTEANNGSIWPINISGNANTASALAAPPTVTCSGNFFPKGVNQLGNAVSCTDPTNNLEALVDGFIYDTNNNLSTINGGTNWTVTSAAGYNINFVGGTFFLDSGNQRVGIGTTSPGYKLDVNGDIRASGKVYELTTNPVIPTGMIMFFNLASCPSGWTAYGAANGRYIVASNVGIGTTVGTQLGNGENRSVGQHNHSFTGDPLLTHSHAFNGIPLSHNHTFTGNAIAGHNHTFTGSVLAGHSHTFTGTPGGNHNHTFNDPGHNHGIASASAVVKSGSDDYGLGTSGGVTSGNSTTGITVNNWGGSITPSGSISTDSAGTPSGTLNSVSVGTPAGTISTDSAGTPAGTISSVGAGTPTGTIGDAGTVLGTNAPYVQLLVCQKN